MYMEKETPFGSTDHSILNQQFGQVCVNQFENCIHNVCYYAMKTYDSYGKEKSIWVC